MSCGPSSVFSFQSCSVQRIIACGNHQNAMIDGKSKDSNTRPDETVVAAFRDNAYKPAAISG